MKPSTMTTEVAEMLALRHMAEQRGDIEPLGRLIYLRTDHGRIEFPPVDGEWSGPDLALVVALTERPKTVNMASLNMPVEMTELAHVPQDALCVLGRWSGLPALRKLTDQPCPKCRHACDLCDGKGKIVCNWVNCGGRGWIPGPWLVCPGPGCTGETGNFKADCRTCLGSGQVAKELPCPCCNGTKVRVCVRCLGTLKYSTGKRGGAVDYSLPPCPACEGFAKRFEWIKQDEKKFMNATLVMPRRGKNAPRGCLALGPIREFAIQDCRTLQLQTFDVGRDEAGDFLMLLVPRSPRQKPQKAYLVGGTVRPRQQDAVSA
jgi:hypothetical protein